ncbi:pre-mRNA-splicing factor cwc22 [Mactra antiquata]
MPRKRHDTSSDESDSSDDDRQHKSVSSLGRRSQNSSFESPKKVKGGQSSKGGNSNYDNDSKRNTSRRQFSSDSDGSPTKRSVVSKVERAGASGRVRDRSRSGRRDPNDSSSGNQQSNRRDESPPRNPKRDERFRDISRDRGQRRGSISPVGHESEYSSERVDFRNDNDARMYAQDRNSGRNNYGGGRGRRQMSPNRDQRSFGGRGGGRREQFQRDEYHGKNRGQNYGNNPRSRSFDRQNEEFGNMNRSRDRGMSDRDSNVRRRSRSPGDRRVRNDSDVSFDKSATSPEPMTSGRGQKHLQKAVREHQTSSPSRSRSPKSDRGRRSVSPRQLRNIQENRTTSFNKKKKGSGSISPYKSKHSFEKEQRNEEPWEKRISMERDSDNIEERMPEVTKKPKGKKKKKNMDKDESVERSFERSKILLESSNDFDENDDMNDPISSMKSMKRSKRHREISESDEVDAKVLKKSKDTDSKRIKKKAKISQSRSPSPVRRPRGRHGSRSLERSFGRNHDMAKFESEPESGEITDSEEDGSLQGKQSVKSLINKPTSNDGSVENEPNFSSSKKIKKSKGKPRTDKQDESKKEPGSERGSKRKAAETKKRSPTPEPPVAVKKPKPADSGIEALTGRTGGAYIPPARLRAMQAKITDKSSVEFQRISWEALKKSINGLVNKVNVANIENIVREIFHENIVRGRGLMARSIIQAQAASPTFTHVYAALVAIVNTKFPQNGELILRRLILQFRRGYKRNDKSICLSATRFVAHLVNHQVAHEVLALEILTLLLETPTDDSVEVAVGFLKECGQKLTEVSPRGINAIFETLRKVLHEGEIDIRVQYMVEVMFAVRKDKFKDFPAIIEELDLVEDEDQFTHLLTLEDVVNGEEILNVFKADPNFEENEEKYKILKNEILGEGSSDEEEGGSGSDSDSEADSDEEQDAEAEQKIIDQTETNMVALRRAIYLTIQSSLDFEECAHKLMKMELRPGQEVELCNMILDCCAQMRTYEKFFGLLAGRFCMLDKKYVQPFQVMFKEQYDTIHRLETNKLRNVAKFFAHLLHTDSISWAVLEAIRLNEDDTTSASRIFIKILFQELSEYLGLPKLNERLKDPTLQEYYSGLLPRDNPRDTRFAINFFTTIGLGGLTDDLRDHLKDVSKKLMQQKQEEQAQAAMEVNSSDNSSDDSSSDDSEDSDDSDSSSSDSDSDSSDDDRRKKKKNRKNPEKNSEKKSKDKMKKDKQKASRKDKDTANGTYDKIKENVYKTSKKDKKKIRQNEEEKKREQEAQFKKLAKLANYGDIDSLPSKYADDDSGMFNDSRSSKKDRKDKRGKEDRGRKRNKDIDDGRDDKLRSKSFNRSDKELDDLDEFDARKYADRSFDSSNSYRDGSGRDGSGRDEERNFGGGARRRGDRGGMKEGRLGREDRGIYDDRMHGKTDRGQNRSQDRGQRDRPDKGRMRKGRGDDVDDEADDRNIRIERNFERMDLYEEKFEREREKNIEQLRDREEFQDYYRGRERDEGPRRGPGPFKDRAERDVPYKGSRNRDSGDNYDFADRGAYDERRGKGRMDVQDRGRNDRGHRRR